MLCPYYGGGKRDMRRLKEFIEELKERDCADPEVVIEN